MSVSFVLEVVRTTRQQVKTSHLLSEWGPLLLSKLLRKYS